jgi:pimeloyl-ACP methyl ester carboxylesterase
MATFVLVHGAFQGGWVWKWTAEALAERGHTAHRPSLTGCGHHRHRPAAGGGLRTYIQDIVRYISDEGLIDVTLVGHSYSGLVCCAVAETLPEAVCRLVLIDAVLPKAGASFLDMAPTPFADMLDAHTTPEGFVRPWPPASFGIGPEATPWFEQRLGLFPRSAFTDAYPLPGAGLPERRAYISCLPAKNPLVRAMTARADGEGFEMHALMSGHCAMITAPIELAGLLHSLVKGGPAPAPRRPEADLPPMDRRLLEDMRRQLHWTCCRLAQGGDGQHLLRSPGEDAPPGGAGGGRRDC